MRLFVNNSRRQFEHQIRPFFHPLYQAALRMTRQVEWAEDLTQDTLVRAYERFDNYRAGTNFRAWLFTILTHTYLNDCERAKRRPVTASYEVARQHGELPEFDESENETDPLEILLTNVLDERIQGALDRVHEEFRLAVLLVDVENLSYQQASEALHVPIGTVRSRVFRGRSLLRALLERDPAGKTRDKSEMSPAMAYR